MSTVPPTTLSTATLTKLAALTNSSPIRGAAVPGTSTGERVPAGEWERPFLTLNHSVVADPAIGVPVFPLDDVRNDVWEERAAIMEYDGGLSRQDAEAMATSLLLLQQMDSPTAQAERLDRDLAALDRTCPFGRGTFASGGTLGS